MELDPIPTSMDQLLEEATRFLRAAATQKGLSLSWSSSDAVPSQLLADPLRLRQILLNLLGNAIKFTERGSVSATVEKESENESAVVLRFAVHDTGPGISADKRQNLFKSFSQADRSIARKHGGTGLGLTISARLVDMMGGRIWVESEPGSGSTFYFTGRFQKPQTDPPTPPPVESESKSKRESLAPGVVPFASAPSHC